MIYSTAVLPGSRNCPKGVAGAAVCPEHTLIKESNNKVPNHFKFKLTLLVCESATGTAWSQATGPRPM